MNLSQLLWPKGKTARFYTYTHLWNNRHHSHRHEHEHRRIRDSSAHIHNYTVFISCRQHLFLNGNGSVNRFRLALTRVKWFSIHAFNTIRRWCMCVHMSEFLFRFFRAHTLTTELNDFFIQITHIYPFTVSDFGSNPRWFWTRCDVMVIMMSDLIYLACVWISNNTTKTSFEQRECAHNIYI